MIWSFSSNTTPATETIQVHTVILSLKKKKKVERMSSELYHLARRKWPVICYSLVYVLSKAAYKSYISK